MDILYYIFRNLRRGMIEIISLINRYCGTCPEFIRSISVKCWDANKWRILHRGWARGRAPLGSIFLIFMHFLEIFRLVPPSLWVWYPSVWEILYPPLFFASTDIHTLPLKWKDSMLRRIIRSLIQTCQVGQSDYWNVNWLQITILINTAMNMQWKSNYLLNGKI